MVDSRPRVYSKDEIVPGVYGWMDCPGWSDVVICELNRPRGMNTDIIYFDRFRDAKILEAYNRANVDGWRLWDKRPTKTQRKFWPWDGTPDEMIAQRFEQYGWSYYPSKDKEWEK